MRRLLRACSLAAFLLLGLVILVPQALAQEEGGPDADDQVVLSGRLLVPEDETVRNAVIFSGDAVVDGTVAESLVVFNGRTEIRGTVGADLVVFNGDVVLRSGARVRGDVISLQDPRIEEGATVEGSVDDLATRWNLYDITFGGRLAWWIGSTVSTLVLGLALLLLAPGLDPASVHALRGRLGATIGFGLLVFFLLPIVAALLIATIVGIPLGLSVLLALGLLYLVGYVVGALALGRLVVKDPTSRYVAFLAGWAVLRGVALVPFLGGLAWLAVTVIGLGTLWVAARSRPRETRALGSRIAPAGSAPS